MPRAGSPGDSDIAGQWQLFGNQASMFSRDDLQAMIDNNGSRLSAGILIVEGYYSYRLILNLPWIQPFIDPEGDGIPFRTFTVIPLPAGEPRATPTPTFTPSPTPSPTPTFTPTDTPGPTATFTPEPPTPTETATGTAVPPASATPVCRPGYVSSTKSSVSFVTGQTWPDYGWADNSSSLRLQVLLVSECDEALSGRAVTIRPERDTTDSAVFEQAIGNQYLYTVRSSSIGQGLFYAVAELCPGDDPLCAASPDTTQVTIAPPRGNFVCVLGTRDVSTSANTLQVMYNNPSPSGTFAWPPYMTRRLVRLVVEFPTASPALLIQSISFGSSANVIWAGGPVAGPSASFGDGTSLLWTSLNRSIISPFRPLQITFNQPITPASGSWTYRVTTIWDDALFGPTCTSAPVVITLP